VAATGLGPVLPKTRKQILSSIAPTLRVAGVAAGRACGRLSSNQRPRSLGRIRVAAIINLASAASSRASMMRSPYHRRLERVTKFLIPSRRSRFEYQPLLAIVFPHRDCVAFGWFSLSIHDAIDLDRIHWSRVSDVLVDRFQFAGTVPSISDITFIKSVTVLVDEYSVMIGATKPPVIS
jgi:hypothetical protein